MRTRAGRTRQIGSKTWSSLTAKNDIDAGENQVKLPFGQLSGFAAKQGTIESDDLRNVGNRVFRKPCGLRGKQDITRGLRPSKIAGQRDADHGFDPASVHGVTLDHHHGPSKAWTRTRGIRQVCPINVALGNYHSTRLSMRLAAAETTGSGRVSTASHTLFIASVTASGS